MALVIINAFEQLKCPQCNGENLHQEKTISMFRDEEDSDGICVLAQRQHSRIDRVPTVDIPGRRDFTQIIFSCEGCRGEKILAIMQSKGQTLVYWE